MSTLFTVIGGMRRPWRLVLGLFLMAQTGVVGCGSAALVDPASDEVPQTELTTGQVVANYVGAPFRAVGAVIVYPLKFLFYDAPVWVYDRLSDPDPVAEAIARLDSPDRRARAQAMAELGASGDERALEALLAALSKEQDSRMRVECLVSLKTLGDARALPDVAGYLDDGNKGVRQMAVLATGALGDRGMIGLLRRPYEALPRRSMERLWYLTALIHLGDERALDDCRALVADDQAPATHRATALWGLGMFAPADAQARLLPFMTDEDERLRVAAATALGVLGSLDTLREFAQGEHEAAAEVALKQIGVQGSDADIPLLRRLGRHRQQSRRFWSTWARAVLDDAEVVPELFDFLEPDVLLTYRIHANEALRALTGELFEAAVAPWREWWQDEGRRRYPRIRQSRQQARGAARSRTQRTP